MVLIQPALRYFPYFIQRSEQIKIQYLCPVCQVKACDKCVVRRFSWLDHVMLFSPFCQRLWWRILSQPGGYNLLGGAVIMSLSCIINRIYGNPSGNNFFLSCGVVFFAFCAVFALPGALSAYFPCALQVISFLLYLRKPMI